jgi:hypothetical protein
LLAVLMLKRLKINLYEKIHIFREILKIEI